VPFAVLFSRSDLGEDRITQAPDDAVHVSA
jgi:hypothetical protein